MSCFHLASNGHVESCLLGALCLNQSFHLPTEEALVTYLMAKGDRS